MVSETWINAATAPQIKTIYRGLDYGFQFWLGASFVSGKRIDWVEAQGQGGQRIFIVPTLDLVTVVTAGNYYGNDRLANLVPQIVFDDYVLPAGVYCEPAFSVQDRSARPWMPAVAPRSPPRSSSMPWLPEAAP